MLHLYLSKGKLSIIHWIHSMFLYLHLHLLGGGLDWAPLTCRSSRPSVCTTEDFVPGKHCPVDAATMKHSEGDMQVQMKNQQTHPLGWDCHFLARNLRECSSLWCKAMLSHMSAQLTTAQGYQTTIQQRCNDWPHYSAPCAPRNNPRGTRLPWKHSRNKLSPNRNQEVYVLLCQLERMVVEYISILRANLMINKSCSPHAFAWT